LLILDCWIEVEADELLLSSINSAINNQQLPHSVAPPRFVTELFSYTLIRGKVERTGSSGASIYPSASFAAS
jgi:hypothetical protein